MLDSVDSAIPFNAFLLYIRFLILYDGFSYWTIYIILVTDGWMAEKTIRRNI